MKIKEDRPRRNGQRAPEETDLSGAETLEVEVKATIYRELLNQLRRRSLSQVQMSELLGIHQPDVSKFLNGHIDKFSVGQLLRFAGRLQMHAEVTVSPSDKRAVGSIRTEKNLRTKRARVA